MKLKTVFNTVAALALGFGAVQAFAAPASASAANARQCDPYWCDSDCVYYGYSGGFCISRLRCECY